MIEIKLLRNEDGLYGFQCLGHAHYAEYGKDIVCAAVSALTITVVNSIIGICGGDTVLEMDQKSGLMFFIVKDADEQARLLLDSMELGLRDLQEKYPDNVKVIESPW